MGDGGQVIRIIPQHPHYRLILYRLLRVNRHHKHRKGAVVLPLNKIRLRIRRRFALLRGNCPYKRNVA